MFKSLKTWLIIALLLGCGTAVGSQIYKYRAQAAAARAEAVQLRNELSNAQDKVLETEGFVKEQEITIEELSAENLAKDERFDSTLERHNEIMADLQERLNDANAPDPTVIIGGEGETDSTATVTDTNTGEKCTADVTVTGDCVFTLVPNANRELHAKGSWYGKVTDKATGETVLEDSFVLEKGALYKLPEPKEDPPTIKERLRWYAGLGYGITNGGDSKALIVGRDVKIPLLGKWLLLGSYEEGTVEDVYCIDTGSNGCAAFNKSIVDYQSVKVWGLKRF